MVEDNDKTEEPCVSRMMLETGEIVDIEVDEEGQSLILRKTKEFADKAYRTLLFAYKDMSMDEFNELKETYNDFSTADD